MQSPLRTSRISLPENAVLRYSILLMCKFNIKEERNAERRGEDAEGRRGFDGE
jgi:hypothetical protein